MKNIDDDFDRRAKVARQRGRLIKLDKNFIKIAQEIRADFNIPIDTGLSKSKTPNNTWRKTEIVNKNRYSEWDKAIKSLCDYLHKPPGWRNCIEQYLLTDFLSTPIYSFNVREYHDLSTTISYISFVQVDEPPKREDVERLLWMLEVPGGYQRKSVAKPRLYTAKDFNLNVRILELADKYPGRDKETAKIINEEFDTSYDEVDINKKRQLFLKRIERERLF
jgi:hypothetical protein